MTILKPLKVKVRNTQEIIFEGEVDRVTSFNEVGMFDVFPLHANFISIIKKGLTLYKKRKKIKELNFEQAVMKVKLDMVNIFLGLEELLLGEEKISEEERNLL